MMTDGTNRIKPLHSKRWLPVHACWFTVTDTAALPTRTNTASAGTEVLRPTCRGTVTSYMPVQTTCDNTRSIADSRLTDWTTAVYSNRSDVHSNTHTMAASTVLTAAWWSPPDTWGTRWCSYSTPHRGPYGDRAADGGSRCAPGSWGTSRPTSAARPDTNKFHVTATPINSGVRRGGGVRGFEPPN